MSKEPVKKSPTKRKVIVKKKPEERKQVLKHSQKPICEITEEPMEYKPIFPPIEEKKVKRRDANYFGIKQKLKEKGLDFFRNVKNGKKDDIEKKPSLWKRYCNWFNNKFNKPKKPDSITFEV